MTVPTPKTASVLVGALALSGSAAAQTFSADAAVATDNSGLSGNEPGVENLAAEELAGVEGRVVQLERQSITAVTTYSRTCDCVPSATVAVNDIRGISDEFVANGNAVNTFGLSNMVWGFGQFVDHDLALTIEDEISAATDVPAQNPDDPMEVHRASATFRRGCRASLNVHTPQIDGGPIYGNDEAYVQSTLREPDTCFLRTSAGNLLPLSTSADAEGRFFFLAGDVRVSEHAFLTAQHHVWLREHNRVCDAVNADSANNDMSEDAKFDLVRNVVVAKFQQIILSEFLPALGITREDLMSAQRLINSPDVSAEFGIAFRLGHDLIGNNVGRFDIAEGFNAEDFYLVRSGPPSAPTATFREDAEQDFTDIMQALSTTPANEIDGKLSNALRNFLFGAGEDLAGRNIFRARELGLPTYAGISECFGVTPDATVEAETPDMWLGLLREPKQPGSPIGPTLRAVLVEQFHRSFFGPGGFYWARNRAAVGSFVQDIESTRYSDIISAVTDAQVSGNVFLV